MTTVLGYQYVSSMGFPVKGAQPTIDEAEIVAQTTEVGRFYSIEQTEHGQIFLRYHYSKEWRNEDPTHTAPTTIR